MRLYAMFCAFLILLLATPSFAFIVTVPEETVVVPIGTSKQIDIKVQSSKADDIAFTVLDSKPWITQSVSQLKVGEDQTKILSIFVTPSPDVAAGIYKISLLAESLITEETQKKLIFVNVNKIEIVNIEKLEVAGNFTPTGQVNIVAVLKNYKPRTVQDIKVTTSINSPSIRLIEFEQVIDSIDAGQTKNVTYSFTLPKQSEPGLYSVVMRAMSEGETSDKTRTFSVLRQAYFVKETEQNPLVFGFSRALTVTNIGNTEEDAVVTDQLTPFEAAFYSGEKPSSTRGGEFTWLLKNVRPGESKTLYYKVDYSSLFLFIVVVVIAGWLFFFKVRIIRVKKYILEKKFIEEGEEFTVGVEVKNSTGKKIEHATVTDFVPSVFNIKEVEGPKPIKKKTVAGTELVWHVKDIHKNEERILSYKILPVFGIHGTIRLPQASVLFVRGKKDMLIKSGYAHIGIATENYGKRGGFFRRKKD